MVGLFDVDTVMTKKMTLNYTEGKINSNCIISKPRNFRAHEFHYSKIINIPKDFLVGFISQLVLLPIIALLIALLLKLPAELAIGLMLIACAPGGVTSNVLTKFADGDVALSITLTAVVSLISIISVPFIMFTSMSNHNRNAIG